MTKVYELSDELHRQKMACFPWCVGEPSDPKMRSGFREKIHAQQIAWPAKCPLSESELREEIKALSDSAKALEDRARGLYARLPEPPDAEFEGEVPPSLYFVLVVAVAVAEDYAQNLREELDRGLAATPERLRDKWLSSQLSRIGRHPRGREADKASDRVVGAVRRVESEWNEDPPADP